MTACPCRDSCKCHGPVPICYHGHYGPLYGRESPPVKGSSCPVYRVTAADCLKCPMGQPGPGKA